MKILLINPPANSPYPVMPLGLAYLAAVLEKVNVHVEVLDAWAEGFTLEDIGKVVGKKGPDIIGITVTTPAYDTAMKTVNVVKQYSNAKIIVGGPHPSALPEQCLQENPNIDYVIIGEGEQTLVEFVKDFSKKQYDFSFLKGIAYRDKDKIINTGYPCYIENLDDLPFPARHLFPIKKYKIHLPFGREKPYMTLSTSRGCPYQCTFCSKAVFGNRYRASSPHRVIEEIKHLVNEYRVKEVHFYDDDFTIDMKRAEMICDEIIRQKIEINWSCTTRVDCVNEYLLKKMKDAGCRLISYGVESGNVSILKRVRKGYTLEKVREIFKLTKKYKIQILGYFMIGLPGETHNSIEETINLSLELNPDFVSWAVVTLLPGSKLYDSIVKGKPIHLTQEQVLQGSSLITNKYIVYEGAISKEQLLKYSNKAHRAFYLRPKYLVKMIFNINSLSELIVSIKTGLKCILNNRKIIQEIVWK